jgi:hypothetical protein
MNAMDSTPIDRTPTAMTDTTQPAGVRRKTERPAEAPHVPVVDTSSTARDETAAEDVRRCPECGSNNLWDNRNDKAMGRRSRNFPDFKCRQCHTPMWLNDAASDQAAALAASSDAEDAAHGPRETSGHSESLRSAPGSARDRTREATRFVLEELKPLYEEHHIPLTELGVIENVRIIAALSTTRTDPRGDRR